MEMEMEMEMETFRAGAANLQLTPKSLIRTATRPLDAGGLKYEFEERWGIGECDLGISSLLPC